MYALQCTLANEEYRPFLGVRSSFPRLGMVIYTESLFIANGYNVAADRKPGVEFETFDISL